MKSNIERSVYLRDRARELGLCDEWFSKWDDDSTSSTLIHKFITGADFCIEHDYPTIDEIKELFTREELRNGGIYVDEDDIFVESPRYPMLLGDTTATFEYSGSDVADIYVRHRSTLTVAISDFSRVSVNVYDKAKVHVVNTGVVAVYVYKYGGEVTFEGNVVVRERRKK